MIHIFAHQKIKNNKRAQTLIEVLVASSLITTVLLAILSLAHSSFNFGGQTGEWITAITLGREGIEVCRNIRNSQWLNEQASWPFGLINGSWIADYGDNELKGVKPIDSTLENCLNCKICFDNSTKNYFHADSGGFCRSGSTATIFRRLITIETGDDLGLVCPDSGDGCEKKITVSVKWTEKNQTHTIKFETRLTNWR